MFAPVWFALGFVAGAIAAGAALAFAVWRSSVSDYAQSMEDAP